MTAQEFVNSGAIRIASGEGYSEPLGLEFNPPQIITPELIAKHLAEEYVGAVAIGADQQIPEPLVAILRDAGDHAWANRYYSGAGWGLKFRNGATYYNDPQVWIFAWSSAGVESAFRTSKRAESEVDSRTFHMMRSAGIEEKG